MRIDARPTAQSSASEDAPERPMTRSARPSSSGHVVDEGHHAGARAEPERGVGLRHRDVAIAAGLVGDGDVRAGAHRGGDGARHDLVDALGALAAAEHEDGHAAGAGGVWRGGEGAPQGNPQAADGAGAEVTLGLGEADVGALRERGEQPVGETEDAVGLEQGDGDPVEPRRERDGPARVPAHGERHVRGQPGDQRARVGERARGEGHAADEPLHAGTAERGDVEEEELVWGSVLADVLADGAALDAARRADVDHARFGIERAHRVPHGEHGEDVPARAASGDEHRHHEPAPSPAAVATSAEALGRGPGATFSVRSATAVRGRLMLRRMPTATALTSSDEPP